MLMPCQVESLLVRTVAPFFSATAMLFQPELLEE